MFTSDASGNVWIQVKNLATGAHALLTKVSRLNGKSMDVECEHLPAAQYELTLQDISMEISSVDLCPGNEEIQSTTAS